MAASAVHAGGRAPVEIELNSRDTRGATVTALRRQSQARKHEAVSMARRMGWPVRGTTHDGRIFELIELNESGMPMYYITMNVKAAISTAADQVRNTAPYNVSGSNIIVGVWDAGAVRPDHQEFVSPDRVVVKDGADNDNHATHVGGTIGAKGYSSPALGMAPDVIIHSYDWDDDLAEMAGAAATAADQSTNINVSNHSYGYLTGWAYNDDTNWSGNSGWHWWGHRLSDREDRGFGKYCDQARDWDALCHNAPYYLPFRAAGNDRDGDKPGEGITFYCRDIDDDWNWQAKEYLAGEDPFADQYKQGGYNTISYNGVAKNIMTVGAVTDAVTGDLRDPSAASMSSFSGWGPADDGRIKPDIVANGVGLESSTAGSTSSYETYSGTSMAAPNAAGSALLLVDYYRNLFPGHAMRAATLKGLIIHTADDMGTPGPNYVFGWGLMNTKAAADHIRDHYNKPSFLFMVEDTINTVTTTQSYAFAWDGSNAIRATLSWADPPGAAQTNLNSTNIVLVNDLDLRIVCPMGVTNYPYVLDLNNVTNAATFGDNIRDNVEQVYIAEPHGAGIFKAIVSHKGELSGGAQDYSLLLSGATEAPETIIVTFDARGGTEPDPSTKSVTFGEDYGPLATTGRQGYSFAGWWTESYGGGTQVTAGTEVTASSDHTLYAHWTINRYVLEIVSAHGDPLPPEGVYTNDYGNTLTNRIGNSPLVVHGTQYVGTGWTLAGHEPSSGTATQMVMTVTNAAVLTWKWSTNYWLATAVSGEGAVDRDDGWIVSGSNVTLTAIASNSWSFACWIGDVPAALTSDTPLTLQMDQARSVTAVFTANTYTVTFDAQDGTEPDPSTKSVTFGEDYGPLATTVRQGYSFAGWWTEPAGGGTQVTAVTEVTASSDHTLYAHWTINRYVLEIVSAHGDPLPPEGVYTNDYGNTLTNRIGNSPLVVHGTQYVGTGWTLAGHEPSSGTATQMVMTVTNDAVLTWQWATNYWLSGEAADDGAHGGVSADAGWHPAGSRPEIVAVPSNYYHFTHWSGDTESIGNGDATNPVVTVRLERPVALVGHFAADLASLGTPHWWLAQHGLIEDGFAAAESRDSDGDGMFNWQEYIADTCPTNAASFLGLHRSEITSESVRLVWHGGVHARQILEYSYDLTQPDAWHPMFTNEPPTNIKEEHVFPRPAVEDSILFYRLRVERP